MEELVESAFIEPAVKEIDGQAVPFLYNLHRMIRIMVEVAAAQNLAVPGMCPPDQQRSPAEEAALQIDLDALATQGARVILQSTVQAPIVNFRAVRVVAQRDWLSGLDIPVADFRD